MPSWSRVPDPRRRAQAPRSWSAIVTGTATTTSGPPTASPGPFLFGLFLANTVVAVVAAIGLTERRLRGLNAIVGVFSVYVGILYLLAMTPPLVG